VTAQATYFCREISTGHALSVQVCAGKIMAWDRCESGDDNLPEIMPGLIDLQVNGYFGHDLNEGILDAGTVEELSNALCRMGVRAYLPTLITASEAELCQRLKAIRQATETCLKSRKMIAGVHIEGPAISNREGPRGAHPESQVRPASTAEFERWQEAAGGLVKIITIAPETEGAASFINYVTARGIIVSLGHSDARQEDIASAVAAGARMSTHLGNGVASVLPRHPNLIWAQLAEERLTASFIADRHHLPKATLLSMIKAKGLDRSVLVSDSVKFAGQPAGRYRTAIGGEVEVFEDGKVSIADSPFLAGSGSCLLDIILGFSDFTGLPMQDAVVMACLNPAHLLGIDNNLAVGQPADFILLDHDQATSKRSVRDIIFNGESVMA